MTTLIATSGLVVVWVAFRLARGNDELTAARLLFWVGLALIVVPILSRSSSRAANRREQTLLVLLAATLLYAVKILHDPTGVGFADEYVHLGNAQRIAEEGRLYIFNPVLPISAQYPGLPAVTAVLSETSGMGLFESGVLVVGAARIILALALFALFERLFGSRRLASVAAVLYCASPTYLFWSAQFSYESLALPLLVATLVCALCRESANGKRTNTRAIAHGATPVATSRVPAPVNVWEGADEPIRGDAHAQIQPTLTRSDRGTRVRTFVAGPREPDTQAGPMAPDTQAGPREPDTQAAAWTGAALILIAGTAVTHHLTAYALAATLWLLAGLHVAGVRARARPPFDLAVAMTLAASGWLLYKAADTRGYLGNIFSRAYGSVSDAFKDEASTREPFQSASGTGPVTPLDDRLLAFGSVVIVAVAVVFGLLLARRSIRRHPLALLLAAGAIAFLPTYSLRLFPGAWETANRSASYVFLGVALLGGVVLLRLRDVRWRVPVGSALALACAYVAFAGGVVIGWPGVARLPRPLHVKVGPNVIEPQGATVAGWVAAEPPRRGGAVLGDDSTARLLLVRGIENSYLGRTLGASELLMSSELPNWQRKLLVDLRVERVILDRRQSSSDNLTGYFFRRPSEAQGGESYHPRGAGRKFAELPGSERVFDSGDIVVYDIDRTWSPG